MNIERTLLDLETAGNLRRIPDDANARRLADFSSNDYLGLAADEDLRREFLESHDVSNLWMTASASRLLAGNQGPFARLENLLGDLYGAPALLFNSGYHANTGLIQALADSRTLIVADRLVHASIIDGIRLSGAPFERFRHNDTAHLARILSAKASAYDNILIIVESVYSMDGDSAPLMEIAALKADTPGAMLYVDEAHAVGVHGPGGLGLCAADGLLPDVDILVGTMGKALASSGAFAILRGNLREFMVNRARSLIFSTALPPACAEWSMLTLRKAIAADDLRRRLAELAGMLSKSLGGEPSHIMPLIVGDPLRAVAMSERLADAGFKVLPIRTPTVPPGTERLRFSLSASMPPALVGRLCRTLDKINRPS